MPNSNIQTMSRQVENWFWVKKVCRQFSWKFFWWKFWWKMFWEKFYQKSFVGLEHHMVEINGDVTMETTNEYRTTHLIDTGSWVLQYPRQCPLILLRIVILLGINYWVLIWYLHQPHHQGFNKVFSKVSTKGDRLQISTLAGATCIDSMWNIRFVK